MSHTLRTVNRSITSEGGPPTVRLLPRVPAWCAGESTASAIIRAASLLGVPLAAWLDRAGVREWQLYRAGDSIWAVRLSNADTERLSQATGWAVEEIRSGEVAAFDGGPVDLCGLSAADRSTVRAVAVSQPVSFKTTRVCPACITETGGAFQLVWRLSAVAVCPMHGCVLVERCDACSLPVGQGRMGRLFPPLPRLVPNATGCCNLVAPGDTEPGDRQRVLCGRDPRTQLPVTLLHDDPAVWAATELTDRTSRFVPGDRRENDWVWWQEFHALASLWS